MVYMAGNCSLTVSRCHAPSSMRLAAVDSKKLHGQGAKIASSPGPSLPRDLGTRLGAKSELIGLFKMAVHSLTSNASSGACYTHAVILDNTVFNIFIYKVP